MIKQKKIKVLYLILNGETYGGSEKHVVDLVNLISNENYDKYLIYSKGNKMIENIDLDKKNNCLAINRNILVLKDLVRIIKEINPDILHLHAARGITIGRLAALICKRVYKMKMKIVATSHGLWLPNNKNNSIYKFFMHFMKRIDDITVAVSENSKEELIKIGYEAKKVITIYNGVDFGYFDKYRNIKNKVKEVGFVGRFTDQKGIKFLLEAIKNDKNKFNFKIYGDGELKSYISDFISENKLTNVKLLGYSNNIGEVFKEIDILLAPSIDEGLPYTLVEASNCGVPIISTKVGGVPEVIFNLENGLIIESGSTKAITKALNQIKELDISSLSKRAIIISQRFSIFEMIQKVEDVYCYILRLGEAGYE